MHAFADWVPLIARWLFVAGVLAGWQTWLNHSLAVRSWPRGEAKRVEHATWSFCLAVVVLVVLESWLVRSSGVLQVTLLPWGKIVFGHNLPGWMATAALLLPPFWILPQRRIVQRRPLLQLEERLASLRRDPARLFEGDTADAMLRELEALAARLPADLKARLDDVRQGVLALVDRIPPEVCLDRAVAALRAANPTDALYWLERWNPAAIETLLVRMDVKDWRGCLDAIPAKASTELHEEILQLSAQVPKSEDLRREARVRMTGPRTLRRRRAVLEFHGGQAEVAQQILNFDWEAANWLRAAVRTGASASTSPQASDRT